MKSTYQTKKEEILQDMLLKYTDWVNGKPVAWNVEKAKASQALDNLVESLVLEVIGEDREKQHVRVCENTHGNCCQCQICGEDHEDCILNSMLDEDDLRKIQRKALIKALGRNS